MILSALECDDRGLTFAAVHDSFWTHAADVNTMNLIIRDSFVRIHSEDVIARLAAEFQARYKGSIYLAKVSQGTEVGMKIMAHRKKTRLSLKDELLQEMKRLSLLNSSDPVEVEKGKKMTTPASILEAMSTAEDLVEPEDISEFGLGSIPSPEQGSSEALGAKSDINEAFSEHQSNVLEAGAKCVEEETDGVEVVDETDLETAAETTEPRLDSIIGARSFAAQMSNPSSPAKKKKKKKPSIQIWLPLTFPDIPKKGDFDVRRLKGSAYFFS
jgi:DNA-directed RNA polymerase